MTKALSEMTYNERKEVPGLSLYEQLYGKLEHDVKRELLAAMRKAGVHRIEATYSGGHDEGGVQEMQLFDAGGELKIVEDDLREPLWDACNEVLSTKFYSWALGCSVYGTLYVDLSEKRAWTSGEIEQYTTDEEPLEWKL
jgi:hypothetical protein